MPTEQTKRRKRNDDGHSRATKEAKAQSTGLLQILAIMLRKALISYWTRPSAGFEEHDEHHNKSHSQARHALGQYFFGTNEDDFDGRGYGRAFEALEAGLGGSNQKVRDLYRLTFLGPRAEPIHKPLLKSLDAIEDKLDFGKLANKVTTVEFLQLVVKKYGVKATKEALATIEKADVKEDRVLSVGRTLDEKSVIRLIDEHTAVFLEISENGIRGNVPKDEIEILINTDPRLRDSFEWVCERMTSVIGPALDQKGKGG